MEEGLEHSLSLYGETPFRLRRLPRPRARLGRSRGVLGGSQTGPRTGPGAPSRSPPDPPTWPLGRPPDPPPGGGS